MTGDGVRLAEPSLRASTRRVWPLVRRRRRAFVALSAIVTALTVATLVEPLIVRFAIDRGIGDASGTLLALAAGAYLLVAVVASALERSQTLLTTRTSEGLLRQIRGEVFEHLQSLSLGFHDRQRSGVLVSRLTADIEALSVLTQDGLGVVVSSLMLFVLSLVVLFALSPVLTLVSLAAIVPMIVVSLRYQRRASVAYARVQERTGGTLAIFQEGVTGARVIAASGGSAWMRARFEHENEDLLTAHRRSIRLGGGYVSSMQFASIAITALIVGVGGVLVGEGLTVGTVVAFVLSVSNLLAPVEELAWIIQTVQRGGAGLRRVAGLLGTASELPEPLDPLPLPERGAIEVRDVTFSYLPARAAVHEISMRIEPTERVALVGQTGAGKSTLAKLVGRLYDPTAGSVSFGGVDLTRASGAELRRRIRVVPQEGFIFLGTIRENVALGRDGIEDAQIEEALDLIGVRDLVRTLPDGLDTIITGRGSGFSAGERQLLSLARVAIGDPAVLILDEATSQLDPATERAVSSAIERLSRGRMLITIAHRLSTAVRADRVAVLRAGRLVEHGAHAELLEAGGEYARLYAAWTASYGEA